MKANAKLGQAYWDKSDQNSNSLDEKQKPDGYLLSLKTLIIFHKIIITYLQICFLYCTNEQWQLQPKFQKKLGHYLKCV